MSSLKNTVFTTDYTMLERSVNMYDLIIRNGKVIDGAGAPSYRADIGITNGKISCISRNISAEGKKIINAEGLVVTPGFIDSHSHSDDAIFTYSEMAEKIEQGITTSIGGQCGISPAPTKEETFGELVKKAEKVALGSNLITFVGHSEIRKAVIGYENRKPTANEMEKMKTLLREAMENGALGISFGLIYTPSCYADTEELIELCKIVKEYEGVVSAHIRNEGFELSKAVSEFLSVIKACDVKAVFSHHKSMYKENWGKVNHTLKMIEDAVGEGYDIYCDVYPYSASATGLVPTIIAKEFRDLDNLGVVNLIKDTDMRRKIKEAYISRNDESLNNLLVTECSGHPEYEGLRIDEIARLRGEDDFETAFYLIEESGATAQICNFSMCEEDIEKVLKYERSMLCTDSSVAKNKKTYHPRLRGSFPRFLGKYVREQKVLSLHEAIRKCTSMPASVYGLPFKGLIREGFDADICIFDAEKIIDNADYINCHKRCEGLSYVILGGEIVSKDAVFNGIKNGRFLKRER